VPIHNPNADPYANALIGLAVSMSAGPTAFIEEQERNGQAELVNSDVPPTEISGGSRADFEAVGFVFGEPVERDDLFTHATLPAGWTRQGTDRAMHSSILDHLGRKRVSVFYKAAFYDRRADMSITTVLGYALDCLNLYGDGAPTMPILDDEWATTDAVAGALDEWAAREEKDADSLEESLPRRESKNAEDCRQIVTDQCDRAAKVRKFAATIRNG